VEQILSHLDLCSGIGGFTLAAGWAGFETIGFSEIDPYCVKVLERHWPHIPNYGDLRRADFAGFRGRVDVLSAGVPCQPASLAGKRRGSRDDRWLWPSVLDVTERVRPAWCLFENPVGILTLDEFGGILLRLESLGYALRAFSVPANAVGAKHRRERVFIVAHADRDRGPRGGGANGEARLEQGHCLRLRDQVKTPKLWPTPTERDWKSCSHGNQDNARPLSEVAGLTGSGSLNPRFVEELMGYPIDHTA